MTTNDKIVAAKIFKTRYGGGVVTYEPVHTREYRVQREWNAYQRLRNSPLKDYIPAPHCLLYDDSHALVGMAVEWEDGIPLDLTQERQQKQFGKLRDAVIRTASAGFDTLPSAEMRVNIRFNPNRNSGFWFSECVIDTATEENYASMLEEIRDRYK